MASFQLLRLIWAWDIELVSLEIIKLPTFSEVALECGI